MVYIEPKMEIIEIEQDVYTDCVQASGVTDGVTESDANKVPGIWQ